MASTCCWIASAALLKYALPPAWLRFNADAWMLNAIPARIATPAMPRMLMATSNSTSDSPRSSRSGRDMSHVHLLEDPVHRRHQGDGDEAHDQAHRDDDDRLEERRELRDLVAELGLVVLRG